LAWPLGHVVARAPAGSIEPGTVARAAVGLGAADTGRVALPGSGVSGRAVPETVARPLVGLLPGVALIGTCPLVGLLIGAALTGAGA
jgi:hypothetical protein